MELYLQFGYGMMDHCRHLVSKWGKGTVVLSPRDLSDKQLHSLAQDINKAQGGKVLLDPQFYLPHSDHERLCSHAYWPSNYSTGTFFQGSALQVLLKNIVDLNTTLDTREIILPGLLATAVDDDWLETQRAVIDISRQLAGDRKIVVTIALDADTTRNQDHIVSLLEAASKWNVHAYYIVCEHPKGDYLVQDPNWLTNVLDLVAGLRLLGANVILGYCNHQMLAAGISRANAICSGTWMNVRSFPPDKFRTSYDEEIRTRAIWYYCPHALSEYKIPFLDIAQRQNLLPKVTPAENLDGGYVKDLFSGPQPTTIGLTEQHAFRHYLHALSKQVQQLERSSYDDALKSMATLLDEAQKTLATLSAAGVRGQQRDFADSIDVNRAALTMIDSLRGPTLRRNWAALNKNP